MSNNLDLYQQTGKMAIGSRLKRLSETFAEQASKAYQLYGVEIDPKWFPVFFLLISGETKSIKTLADAIGHSHASVSKIVKEMTAAGVAECTKDVDDGRVNRVCLTDKGRELIPKFQLQAVDVDAVVSELLSEASHDLWEAISEMEYLLSEKALFQRIREKYQQREQNKVCLVPYEAKYAEIFRELNYQWIEKYFELEDSDIKMLNAPDSYIIANGGYILIALYEGDAIGTCALIKQGDKVYELAKMAVSEKAQGKRVGWLLGKAVLQKAREINAESVYLESNTRLEPAINLYKKLGFKKVTGKPSPYGRCNIQMEILL